MITNIFKCCFPNTTDKLIKDKDFSCEDGNLYNYQSQNQKSKIANVFTMGERENGQMLNKRTKSNDYEMNIVVNNNESIFLNKDMILSPNIILDRLKLYNQSKNEEIFKSKLKGLSHCKTIVKSEANVNNSMSSSEKIFNNKRTISYDEEVSNHKLSLSTIFGDLFKGETLLISASGLRNSLRNERDGITYFGIKDKQTNKLSSLVDYEINITSNSLSQVYSSIVFIIYFNSHESKYYLKAYKDSQSNKSKESLPNLIVQIKDPYYINNKELLMLNDCYFQLKPSEKRLDIIQLPSRYCSESKTFSFSNTENKVITIGRDQSCDINLSWDKSYSKFQCEISWDVFLEQWKIEDGGKKGASRNGTWIFVFKSIEIRDGTCFRVANSKVEIRFVEPDNQLNG